MKVKPRKLYLIADGPKNDDDRKICDITRKVIQKINWECDVIRLYQDVNIGLQKTFKQGLDYVFEKEERAIILEDDTLPNISFFRYCDELLDRYETNPRIAQINGYNYLSKVNIEESYYYSNYIEIWGWATWRDRWNKHYNKEFQNWNNIKHTEDFKDKFQSSNEYNYFYDMFENANKKIVISWEYPWTYSIRKNQLLAIAPKINLVKNLGFGHTGATHTHQKHKYLSVTRNKKFEMSFPLISPLEVDIKPDLNLSEFNKRLLKNSKLSLFIYRYKKIIHLLKKKIES
jgi:hypothetical protein